MTDTEEGGNIGDVGDDEDEDKRDVEELEDLLSRSRHRLDEPVEAFEQRRAELLLDLGDAFAREDASDGDLLFLLVGDRGQFEYLGDDVKKSCEDKRIDGQCYIYIFYLIKDDKKHASQREDR